MPINIIFAVFFALLGAANAGYLVYARHQDRPLRKLYFEPDWCSIVINSDYGKTLGIPNEYLGFTYFSLVILLSLINLVGLLPFWPITLLVSVGLIFTFYYTAIQGLLIKVYCDYCIISATVMILLAFIVLFLRT